MSLRGQQQPGGINAEIKVRKLDNSLGVVLPKDFMNRLHTKGGHKGGAHIVFPRERSCVAKYSFAEHWTAQLI